MTKKSIKRGLILFFAELHGVAISKGHTNTQKVILIEAEIGQLRSARWHF